MLQCAISVPFYKQELKNFNFSKMYYHFLYLAKKPLWPRKPKTFQKYTLISSFWRKKMLAAINWLHLKLEAWTVTSIAVPNVRKTCYCYNSQYKIIIESIIFSKIHYFLYFAQKVFCSNRLNATTLLNLVLDCS